MKRYILATLLAVSFAAPAAAQTAAVAVAPMSPAQYQQMAASSDQFEIQSSQMALDRATSPAVRNFAARMVRDHTVTTQLLMQTAPVAAAPFPFFFLGAATTGGPAVGGLAPHHAQMLAQLAAVPPGRPFDRAYMQMQVAAHQEAVALHSTFARTGVDPGLRAVAAQATPIVRSHLSRARSIARRV